MPEVVLRGCRAEDGRGVTTIGDSPITRDEPVATEGGAPPTTGPHTDQDRKSPFPHEAHFSTTGMDPVCYSELKNGWAESGRGKGSEDQTGSPPVLQPKRLPLAGPSTTG
jgi:hypothetical protein